jgi:hypothetical protein
MAHSFDKVLFHHAARNPKPGGDLIDGAAITTLKDEDSTRLGRKSGKRTIERLEPPLEVQMGGGIGFHRKSGIDERIHHIHRFGHGGSVQCVLVQDMAGNGQQVGFGTADLIVAFDTQQAQKDFLRQVGHVRRIAQPGGQKATQSLAVFRRNVRYKGLSIVGVQGRFHRKV